MRLSPSPLSPVPSPLFSARVCTKTQGNAYLRHTLSRRPRATRHSGGDDCIWHQCRARCVVKLRLTRQKQMCTWIKNFPRLRTTAGAWDWKDKMAYNWVFWGSECKHVLMSQKYTEFNASFFGSLPRKTNRFSNYRRNRFFLNSDISSNRVFWGCGFQCQVSFKLFHFNIIL